MKLGVSSCLLGQPVRYDGGHKLDRFITGTLGKYFAWVPVCPEVESGLPVPREEMRLVGDPESPRLITRKTGLDHTKRLKQWARRRIRESEFEDLGGFIFKSKSPSCGLTGVEVRTGNGAPSRRGRGIFGSEFVKRFPLMPVIDEGRLHEPALRENFIEQVFTYRRWKDLEGQRKSLGRLVEFHTAHKLLIMSHSPKHYRDMGRLIAVGRGIGAAELYGRYAVLLMDAMGLLATVKKNTNVLQHMMGYFKKILSPDEKRELLAVIELYLKGHVPLVVPLTLIKHNVKIYGEQYLASQIYLNPHPMQLMLRNHV